jgi:gliding motility-associated-like protein
VKNECNTKQDGSVTTTLSGGRAPYSVSWNNGATAASITNLSQGTYTLAVTDQNGCLTSFSTTVGREDCSVNNPDDGDDADFLLISQLLTPNGDGSNDTWRIDSLETLKNVSAEVFNRYGEWVYKSSRYRNEWKGTFRDTGNELPDGTYFFLVTIERFGKKAKTFTGYLVIQH